ncbi:hypothetical protein M8494_11730 [Serratia ureilytica]
MMPAFGSACSDEEVAACRQLRVSAISRAKSPPNRWRSSASGRKRRGSFPRRGVSGLRRDITRLSSRSILPVLNPDC